MLFKDSGTIEPPDEAWILEVLPELNSLEGDTLDMLLVQAETHARYEKAARQLFQQERSGTEREPLAPSPSPSPSPSRSPSPRAREG